MAAGTLSVTNNSKAVVGVGTTFTAFTAGDFLSLVVGQVPYTIAIASVESDTALTLVLPFDGPTATDLAWDGVKRDTMSLATMGVTVQAQKALRLMLADENNWRAIFGDEEEITITLPNGKVMQGMSWGYLSQLLKEVDPVEMRNLQQQAAASEAAAQGFRNEAEGLKTETAGIRDDTNQIKTDTQAIHDATNTIKTQTDQIKTDTQAVKDQTNQIKTDTGVIRDEANAAKLDAQAARDAAKTSETNAEQWAQSVNANNLLTKSGNLAGITDSAEARNNLGLGPLSTANVVPVENGGTGVTRTEDLWPVVRPVDVFGNVGHLIGIPNGITRNHIWLWNTADTPPAGWVNYMEGGWFNGVWRLGGVRSGNESLSHAQITVNSGQGSEAHFMFYPDGSALAANWVSTSDPRVKSLVEVIPDPLDLMRSIRGYSWYYEHTGSKGFGFLSSEVKVNFRGAVKTFGDAELPDGTVVHDVEGVDVSGVSAALHHEAILALMDKMEDMQKELEDLKTAVAAQTKA